MRVARLVATSRRSMGGEHAWVNLDVGIAYVLGRTDRQVIRRDRVRAAGISCSLPKICGGKHQPDERRLFRPLIRKPLMPQAAQSSLGTITRSEQSALFRCRHNADSVRVGECPGGQAQSWICALERPTRQGGVVDGTRLPEQLKQPASLPGSGLGLIVGPHETLLSCQLP